MRRKFPNQVSAFLGAIEPALPIPCYVIGSVYTSKLKQAHNFALTSPELRVGLLASVEPGNF